MIRKEKRTQVAYGRNNVLSCLEAGIVLEIIFQDGFYDDKITNLATRLKLKVKSVSKKELSLLATGNHQGVVAIVSTFHFASLEEIIYQADNSQNPIILMLDELKDPHNLGAIIRSAEAFGVSGIIFKKDRQVSMTPTVMKVATGAQNNILICEVVNLNQTVSKLKEKGYWVVSTEIDATRKVSDLKYDFKTVLVVGSEDRGVSSLLSKNSDYIVKIPMQGQTNSLNVSVATGIMLALIRQIQLYL